MSLTVTETTVKNILTRTSGFLRTVCSHSVQPYRGCTYGKALCGVGCYVQHNGPLLRGRAWGSFLEVRTNAAESYRANYAREARWARQRGAASSEEAGSAGFSIFLSSATDPFVPQEATYRVTEALLHALCELPPDRLMLQTHSHRVIDYLPLYLRLRETCDLRVHVSIETDRERLPGLPPHASPLDRRFEACARLKEAGVRTVVTVSPLLPIADPEAFFARIAEAADACVIDHYIQGDGSPLGQRTARTPLPAAIAGIDPAGVALEYRDRMVEIARRHLPGCVGVNIDGFAGRYLP